MVQIQLITSVIEWERGLEFEEDRRKNHRSEPYVNYLAAPRPCRNEKKHREASQTPVDLVKALNPYSTK